MNPSRLSRKLSTCSGALALSLLFAAASAAALTNTAVRATAAAAIPAAPVAPGRSNLVPAAPVSSQIPTSSAEDIRDLRQPSHPPTRWFWVAVAAGILALAAAPGAVWWWIRHGKLFVMTPHEIALQYLDEARRLLDPDQAREYCFEVSEIIRRYVEERFLLRAPQLTTEKFLHELVDVRETMPASQRALLGDFLQHCDLARSAGWHYCRPDLEAMHDSAGKFIRQTAEANPQPDPQDAPASDADAAAPGLERAKTF